MKDCRNYNRNHFFFAWDLYSLFFIQGVFKSHLKKNHPHLKCQFPPKIPIWTKSLLYKCSEKWLSPFPPPPPITQGGANYVLYLIVCTPNKGKQANVWWSSVKVCLSLFFNSKNDNFCLDILFFQRKNVQLVFWKHPDMTLSRLLFWVLDNLGFAVILPSMLMIFSTWSVIMDLIYGNN